MPASPCHHGGLLQAATRPIVTQLSPTPKGFRLRSENVLESIGNFDVTPFLVIGAVKNAGFWRETDFGFKISDIIISE
jgi:hypothetical protein